MSDDALDRRFPRRLLLGGGAAAAALAAVEAIRPAPAAAAPTTNPWVLGGNNVSTDGTNFIGVKNKAPIIFKTPKTDGSSLVERMRLTPLGDLGLGTASPTARLDVVGNGAVSVSGRSTLATATGVQGVSTTGTGVRGDASEGTGVRGQGGALGGAFDGSTGVQATGTTVGVDAVATASAGVGVNAAVTSGTAVYGRVGSGVAVRGIGGEYAVLGDGAGTAGVRGNSAYVGAWGQAGQYGVYGRGTATSGPSYGVYGSVSNPEAWAMWAQGNLRCTGTVSKSAGSFQIDHPLDPDQQWLSHSFVESPDMMNVYNGNVVLGADGTATVELPRYFGALNREFRYQLTCVGGHAPVYVSQKVTKNRFAIAGGTPGLEVSWLVTGIRQDDYAKAHPIVVEQPKTGAEKGTRQFVPAGSTARQFQAAPAG